MENCPLERLHAFLIRQISLCCKASTGQKEASNKLHSNIGANRPPLCFITPCRQVYMRVEITIFPKIPRFGHMLEIRSQLFRTRESLAPIPVCP